MAAEGEARADKSGYTLFNPTPRELLRELSADRPDKTDCPFTIDAGHFQMEMDFANATYNAPSAPRGQVRTLAIEAAPMNIKVGLLNNLDFQLVLTPFRAERTEDTASGTVHRITGFEGMTPRFKVNLMGNDGGFLAIGLLPFVRLPLSTGQLPHGHIEGGLGVPVSFDIPGWEIGLQSTVHINRNEFGVGYHGEFDNALSVGHALFGRLSMAVEFYGSVSADRGAGWIGTVDTWLTFQVNADWRLDAGVYIGVTSAADDWHPFVGMTRRF